MHIEIKGKNIIDTENRKEYLETLNELKTDELAFLEKLVKTPKALKKLMEKADMLMRFL